MSLKRVMAVMRARFREFYRDTMSWTWNLLMPILFMLAFAFIFSGEEQQNEYKVAVLERANPVHAGLEFLNFRYILFVDVDDLQAALARVQRHQYDLLLDLTGKIPRYWVNEYSAKGYLVEKLLRESLATGVTGLERGTVSGRDVRYVDWLLPGLLAMNMMFSCLWGVGWVVVRYRKNGVLRRLQATPLTPFEFLTAQVIARLITIVVVTAMVVVSAMVLVDFTMRGSWLALFLVFLAGSACLISMGLLVATRLKTEEMADGLLNLISWPMMLFSGVWFSMEGTHPLAQLLSQMFPLTYLVDAARRIMIDGAGVSGVWYEIALLTGLTLLLLGISARLFRWS